MAVEMKVKLLGDIDGLLSSMRQAERQMQKFSRNMTKIGKDLTTHLTLPLAGLGYVAVKNYGIQAEALAKLESQIAANGKNVASVSAKYQKWASEIQKVTTVGDEVTLGMLQMAESMKAADPQAATKNAIALSKALGVDLNAAIKMAVMAQQGQYDLLNRYVPALRATKDGTEKAAIANKLFADGFKVAQAEAATGLGPLKQLKNTIGDLSESFGKIIVEGITPMVNHLKKISEWLNSLTENQRKWIVMIAATVAAVGPLLYTIGKIPGIFASIIGAGTQLIGVLRNLVVFIASNPWILLAAAIAGAVAVIYTYTQRATEAERVQKTLNDVNEAALYNTLRQRVEVDQLLKVAQDETKSKEQRIKAIQKLNEISPEYLGGLTLEKINTEEAKAATDKYIEALLKKARIQAAEEKLVEVQKKLLDLQTGQSNVGTTWIDGLWSSLKNLGSITGTAISNAQAAVNAYTGEQAALNAEIQALGGFIADASGEMSVLTTTTNANSDAVAGANTKLSEYVEYMKLLQSGQFTGPMQPANMGQVGTGGQMQTMQPVAATSVAPTGGIMSPIISHIQTATEKIDEFKKSFNSIADSVGGIYGRLRGFFNGIADFAKQAADGFKEGWKSAAAAVLSAISNLVSVIGDILNQQHQNKLTQLDEETEAERTRIESSIMSEESKNKALSKLDKDAEKKRKEILREQAKDQKTVAIINAIINGALAVVMALGSAPGPAGIIMAAIVGALAAVQIAMIAAQPLPALAEGGLAFAPTMAMVGDNPNAHINPEVIAPLSKLQGLLGVSRVEVYGRLSGEDILLAGERANDHRERTRGF